VKLNRLVRLLAIGLASSALSAGVIACAPKQETQTPPVDTTPKPPPSEDIAIEDLSEIKLEGQVYTPGGLTSPGMARVKTDGRKLATQRKTYAKAKPDKKVEEARVLATMLWDEARNNPANAAALQTEAIDVLRQTKAGMGEASDPVLLQMLFAAAWRDGKMDEAMQLGAELLAKHPDSSVTKAMAPWVAYGYLLQGKNAEATQVAQTWTIQDQGITYIHPYVTAWVAFRQNNDTLARQAMLQAARTWQNKGTWSTVEGEVSLLLAHTGASVEEAVAAITELAQEPTARYYWLYQTNEEYARAGRFAEASELLNAAASAGGAAMKPSDLVTFRNKQFNYELVELNVDRAADYAIQTHQAVLTCGQPCAQQAGPVAEQISKLAQFLHTIYSTTLDERFYVPAKKLYEHYLTLGQPDTETLRTYLNRLEETKKLAKPENGKHNKAVMDSTTSLGRPDALKACYVGVLQGEATLAGAVKATIEIDAQGKVSGVSTDPAVGETGLGAVANCVQEEIRTWLFPARTLAGTTRVVRTYSFAPAPQQPKQPPAAPAAAEPAAPAGTP
jgi:hypothetical protein